MSTTKAITAHRIFGMVLSVAVLIVGICLMAGCLYIYYTGGEHPYSREAIASVFSVIAAPVVACLLLTVIGFAWEWIAPLPFKKPRPSIDNAWQVARLTAKKQPTASDASVNAAVMQEHSRRHRHITVRTLLILIGAVVFAVYALNTQNYDTTDINGSMIRAMAVLLPCTVVPFGYSVFAAYAIDKSYQREIALLKTLPNSTSAPTAVTKSAVNPVTVIRFVLLVVAAAILLYGFFAGGTADVLTKAVNICTECIGLG